jgi:hypothetical protein
VTELLEELRRAAEAPAPKDFRPGIVYSGRDALGATITTGAIEPVQTEEEWEDAVRAMGIHLPEGYGLVLVTAEVAGSDNPAAWKRDPEDKGGKDTAYTGRNVIQRWRYKFKVVLKDPRADTDIAVLAKEARKVKHKAPLVARGGEKVINLADFQVSKTDVRGGTAELLERSEIALAAVLAEIRRDRPTSVILVDEGDSTEGFESAPNAARTNDLQMTESIRVWRRILWRWTESISRLVARLRVVSVPSNHCRVRQGKNYVGTTLDDWGIEVLAQVADIAAGNPEAFGHIEFIVPSEHEEYVLLDLENGKTVAFVHGHQVSRPEQLVEYIKRNSRRGIGQADYVFVGHFHHLRIIAFGDSQFLFVCPTNDNGSTWFAASGEFSDPGVLVVTFNEDGTWSQAVHWT